MAMDRIPDITEQPWWTAVQPYRAPDAPEMPQNTNIYIDEEDADEC